MINCDSVRSERAPDTDMVSVNGTETIVVNICVSVNSRLVSSPDTVENKVWISEIVTKTEDTSVDEKYNVVGKDKVDVRIWVSVYSKLVTSPDIVDNTLWTSVIVMSTDEISVEKSVVGKERVDISI